MSVRTVSQTKRLLDSSSSLGLLHVSGQRSLTDDRPELLAKVMNAKRQRTAVTGFGLHVDMRESGLDLYDPQSELEHVAILSARRSVPVTFKVTSVGKGVFRPYIDDDI